MPKHVINDVVVYTMFDQNMKHLRCFDWKCVSDSYDGIDTSIHSVIGYGSNEQDAIDNWRAQRGE